MNGLIVRATQAALALVLVGAVLVLGAQYPLSPVGACLCLLAATLLSAWRPSWWLFLLPALLPVLNFSPWTGWWLLDESDLLVLALAAGAYARWSFATQDRVQRPGLPWWLWSLLLASLAWGVGRGLVDAGFDGAALAPAWRGDRGWTQGLYATYDSAWNTLRVAKSLAWGLLLAPLLRSPSAQHGPEPALLLARGMVTGLALVCAVVLWERLVYTGLFEFSLPYRTTAWFWEMHMGGGAIDAYLAMAAPFAFWAIWSARTLWPWLAANVLLWVTVYAVLTTYSRGVCLAMLLALVFMATVAWKCRIRPAAGRAWGRRGLTAMFAAVGLQSALVLGGGTFMADRLVRSDVDLIGRVAHWAAGVSLLQDREDLALGLGIGRLPTHYSQQTPNGELSGSARWQAPSLQAPAHVELAGPAARDELLGLFAMTQQVALEGTGQYRARLRVRTDETTRLVVSLCERHLLYNYQCQWQYAGVEASEDGSAEWLDVPLGGDAFEGRGLLQGLRSGVLAISSLEVGRVARIEAVELFNPQGRQVLLNTGFAEGMPHWFTMARRHFLAWHMDNLYLELLIERGLSGWLVLCVLALWAGHHVVRGLRRSQPLALALAGSLLSMGLLGMVVSAVEIPRIALLLLLILFTTSRLAQIPRQMPLCNRL